MISNIITCSQAEIHRTESLKRKTAKDKRPGEDKKRDTRLSPLVITRSFNPTCKPRTVDLRNFDPTAGPSGSTSSFNISSTDRLAARSSSSFDISTAKNKQRSPSSTEGQKKRLFSSDSESDGHAEENLPKIGKGKSKSKGKQPAKKGKAPMKRGGKSEEEVSDSAKENLNFSLDAEAILSFVCHYIRTR